MFSRLDPIPIEELDDFYPGFNYMPLRVTVDIVELDTMDVRPLPGTILKHFYAYDMVSKWNVLGIFSRATSETAKRFLDDMERRTPNKIKVIQIDSDSEFQSVFEKECQKLGIILHVLPSRSLKLNGVVEMANRTHTEEFYEMVESTFELADIRHKLLEWEGICNTIRPNQAITYLTPSEKPKQFHIIYKKEEVMYHYHLNEYTALISQSRKEYNHF